MSGATSRDLCVLFSDVSDSTRLYEKLGDEIALQAIEACLSVMERSLSSHNGRLVKSIGDGVMVVFESTEDGFQAAMEMQAMIDNLPTVSGVKLSIRIGFHFGPVLVEESGDVFGDTVNTAARMVALAKRGQILTTEAALLWIPSYLRHFTRYIDALHVKGKAEAVLVHEVLWQESDDQTVMEGDPYQASSGAFLRIRFNGSEMLFGTDREMVTLGRDPQSDLVIFDSSASRSHGQIERRRDRFVLVDHSTNGTYVSFQGEGEILLKHEELVLRGQGQVSFGHAYTGGSQLVLIFEVLN